MPIYEYQCRVCGHQLEALQSLSEQPLAECPACHGKTLDKLVSAAGLQFKGSGWYLTDYSDKQKAKSESNTSSTTESTPSNNAKDTAPTTTKDKGETSS